LTYITPSASFTIDAVKRQVHNTDPIAVKSKMMMHQLLVQLHTAIASAARATSDSHCTHATMAHKQGIAIRTEHGHS
jgi:hypothetical protein